MSQAESMDLSEQRGMFIVEDSEPDPVQLPMSNPTALLQTLPALNPNYVSQQSGSPSSIQAAKRSFRD